ncbi:alpha/beta hydrolase [Rhizobium sp. L1K21]|uniref:alpha/beta hydrolase n=1 Tax=Rhizobium sp. L1K21 TaxID=2954933 RepID=UPI0020930050|nr:alpha/beta hydrolase [Rhizobium sp. L1K21]MCO6184689.1 alpha/beta hydrolase [Rhizobium sp. L1K21]
MKPSEKEILAFQARCDAFYPPDAVDASVAQQREWYDALCAAFSPALPSGLTYEDSRVAGVKTRRYRPSSVTSETLLLYLHGGGFVVGSLESHHSGCAEIAEAVGAEMVAVDYRLAPEHIWPAQTDDCYTVLKALLSEERPVIVMGDSAGGNLAAGLVLRAAGDGRLEYIVGQVLIYPVLGGDLGKGSYIEMAEAPGLTTADVRFYADILGAPSDNPIAHPLKAESLAGLPPAYITAAHFDPLRDDGRNYAARLAQAGVDVTYREEPQMVHAWLRARHISPGAKEGFRALTEGTKRLLR